MKMQAEARDSALGRMHMFCPFHSAHLSDGTLALSHLQKGQVLPHVAETDRWDRGRW